jgi:hypothetical protein
MFILAFCLVVLNILVIVHFMHILCINICSFCKIWLGCNVVGICICFFLLLAGCPTLFFLFLAFHYALHSICCSIGFAFSVCSFFLSSLYFTIICVVHLLSITLLSFFRLLFGWIIALLRFDLLTLLCCCV